MEVIKPDFFHIGIPKAGSTSIQNLLEKDKRVVVTRSRFYTSNNWWKNYTLKEQKNKIVIESNETLISGGFQKVKFGQTIERFHRINPNAKIILVIRDQRKATLSMFKYHIKHSFYGTKSFENWLFKTDLGMDYLSLCFYGNILEMLLMYFSKEQIKVLFFEELISNEKTFYEKLYDFIGLKLQIDTFEKSNINSLTDNQLYTLSILNNFSFNPKKSENPFFSKTISKIEKKLKNLIIKNFTFTPSKNFFDWNSIKSKEKIFNDFAYSNNKIIELGFVTKEDLKKYKYIID